MKTEATTGKGVPELVEAIERFRAHTAASLGERRRARAEFRVRELLAHRFVQHVDERVLAAGEFEALLDRDRRARDRSLHGGGRDHHEVVGRSSASGRTCRSGSRRSITSASRWQTCSEALAFYRDALGLEVEAPEEVASQRVRAHFIPVGESALELLEATADDSPIAKYVAKRGPGLHHITLRVRRHPRRAGAAEGERRPPDRRAAARPGAHGSLVAFIHPVQRARRAGRAEAERRRCRSRAVTLGDLELTPLLDGYFRLDGGAMFGVVPKPLWEKRAPADERNRIPLAMRPLLVRGASA